MIVSRRKVLVAVLITIAAGLCALQLLSTRSSVPADSRRRGTPSPPDFNSSSSSSDAIAATTKTMIAPANNEIRNANDGELRHSKMSSSKGEGSTVQQQEAVPTEQDEAAAVAAAVDGSQLSTDGGTAASSHDGGGSHMKRKSPKAQPRNQATQLRFDFNRAAYPPQPIANLSIRLVSMRLPSRSMPSTSDRNERATSAEITKKRPKIAMCFFGLVKNLQDSKAHYYENNIFRPLRDAGYIIDAFMHTYDMANHTYFNRANGEGKQTVLKQSESIDKLVRLLPELTHIQYSDPREADMTMPELGSVLVNGNPWHRNGNLSMKYYLRQLYSVMKVTEMWSNISVVSSPSAEVLFGRDTNEADDGKTKPVFQMTPQAMSYDCVMYLRADLRFSIKLNIKALHNICSRQNDDLSGTTLKTDVAVPAFEYGGYNDRFAFGTPAGMFLYGVRGLMLHRFINLRVSLVHAETYLRRFLCDNSVPVHLVPMYQQRVRAQGHVSDQGAHYQRDVYFKGMLAEWGQWNLYSHRTAEEGRRCAPVSVWGESFS